jgi:NTE family protein
MRAATAAARQAAELTRAGHAVVVVSPDPPAVADIGRNVLDPARRAPAARAGHAQAGPALDRVGTVWAG